MRFFCRISVVIIVSFMIISCDDDGSSATGNTNEYFKYTVNGTERIFDYEVEAHLETDSSTIIDRYEINASGLSSDGNFRRIAASFSFDSSNGAFMPSTSYNWGLAMDNNPTERFYFAENSISNPFILTLDFNTHPIVATITTAIPNSVGDYMEFSFTGSFTDENGNLQSISGECRAQRDIDQIF